MSEEVKITWLVAPQGETPPQVMELVELTKLSPKADSVAELVPFKPPKTAEIGIIEWISPFPSPA